MLLYLWVIRKEAEFISNKYTDDQLYILVQIIIITRIWHVPAKHANRMDARAHSSTLAECAPKKL